jgi:hypothetical protein
VNEDYRHLGSLVCIAGSVCHLPVAAREG